MNLRTRRWRFSLLTTILLVLVTLAILLYAAMLRDASFPTGWLLVAITLLLMAYNLRKKIPVLPLGRASSWFQLHVYGGFLAVWLFALHVGLDWPSGVFETLLWCVYVGVLVSGLFGLAITRLVPSRLGEQGAPVIHETIPIRRARIAGEAELLVTRSVDETALGTIADYYGQRLRAFFLGPRHFWSHLFGSRRASVQMLDELRDLERYLPPSGRDIMARLQSLVVAKDDLDHQHAWQRLLKIWLFAHIPLTYSAVLLIAVHVVLVHAFAGTSP